jgi:hypothetical protein
MVESESDAFWIEHCGFLDLSLEQFTSIQETMLLEQLRNIGNTTLEQRIIGNRVPTSIKDFRNTIPLTTYSDYLPELGITNEDTLPEKPYVWVHTSGQGTAFLDIPYTKDFYNRILKDLMAIFILSCSTGRGESTIQHGDRVLFNVAPSPYLGGLLGIGATEQFDLVPVIRPDEHNEMDFSEKIKKGFEISLKDGVDITIALTSVLVKMGKDFNKHSGNGNILTYLTQPGLLFRYTRALINSKLAGRDMLPRDLWPMKSLIGWGMDTSVYREMVAEYWGKYPYEFHACTEAGIIAMQSWTRKGMTIVPYTNFFEFIPESEWQKNTEDSSYEPRTVLLPEVEEGRRYELVITNFHRMPFVRYRLGHLIKVTSLRDDEGGISLPQISFEGRADELIDIASFTRLSEKTLTQAIANTKFNVEGWAIRKEIHDGQPLIVLYAEVAGVNDPAIVGLRLHQELKKVDLFYDDLDSMMNIQPIRVEMLNSGTFSEYSSRKQDSGAELSQLKPPKMNASDEIIAELLRISETMETESISV